MPSRETRNQELTRSTYQGQFFGFVITQRANALKAVFLDAEELTSVGVPTPPCESITIDQAMIEDEIGWVGAITKELQALQATGTFTVIKGVRILLTGCLRLSR
ncbi:hypothetical protein K3495_g11567 [Podosphaera aphanis]|nr:hypothetical protein K3495_g11567 [Podosphaera aphanis]